MSEIILSARALSIGYRMGNQKVRCVQEGLNFDLVKGKVTCLLGPNGAGKSTLLRTLSATQPALAGELTLQGKSLADYRERELSQLLGLVLTDKSNCGGLKVEELVALGRYPHIGFFGRMSHHDKVVVEESMCAVGIDHKSTSYVAELSDGERQKVMIAKALAQECPLIILDEPTAFLDVVSRIEIMNLLHSLAQQGRTILLSTHDIEQALLLTDRLWLLSKNAGLICGTTEDLVFSGAMDTLFDKDDIVFDKRSGSFRSEEGNGEWVTIEANDQLMFWTKNVVVRSGFRVAEAGRNTEIVVKAHTPNHIDLVVSNRPTLTFDSFETLSQALRTRK